MATAIESKRGRRKLTHEGHIYIFDKGSADGQTEFWRCERKDTCKGRVHVREARVCKIVNGHSHDTCAAKIEADTAITSMKRRAEETVECTVQVINECSHNLSEAAQGQMPKYTAASKMIRRRRHQIAAPLPNPDSLDTMIIPDKYKVYVPQVGVEEQFLLADSGPGRNRILIFGRQVRVQVLQDSQTWFVDGTFRIAPPLFSQVYVILGQRLGGVHPILYALLPNKQLETYRRLLTMVNALLPNLQPNAVSCDFELAAIRAIQEVYPNADVMGCFFHLCHNLKKRVAELGLTQCYNSDPNFALQARMVAALAFVPIDDLDEAVDELANLLPAELQQLLVWFEDNYLGRQNRRGNGRRPALFPPQIWSVHERVLRGENRTNNHAEAAHRRLQKELSVDHPTLWYLIDSLRKVQKGRDTYYEQLVAGHAPPAKLKKYQDADRRIERLVQGYSVRNMAEYLRGLAHNYDMAT